jgi:hypothetical protein
LLATGFSTASQTTVASRVLSGLASVRFTLAYAAALLAVAIARPALGPHVQNAVVAEMSTNLHNLSRGHLDTLIGSAFIPDGGQIYVWLPGMVCVLALGELVWRGRRLVLAFALGHIGATLLVAVWLTVAISMGWLPITIAHASDVGISYGVAGVLGALTAVLPRRWRTAWIGLWLGIAVFKASGGHFTPIGHMLALMLGMGLSVRLGQAARWTPLRVVLLAVGAAYGVRMIAGSSLTAAVIAGLTGVLVALTIHWLANRLESQVSIISAPLAPAHAMA